MPDDLVIALMFLRPAAILGFTLWQRKPEPKKPS
jgi:hypothetical protein